MAAHSIEDLKSISYWDIIKRKKQTPFIVFISFVLSFAAARLTIMYGPEWLRFYIRTYHIHHFYYGFALLAIANWIALTTNREHMFKLSAVLFGVGLGLIVDEIGLLLTCTTPPMGCDYWARQSYDVFMVIAGVLLAVLYSKPVLSRMSRMLKSTVGLFKRK
jgi:hypothetical protein